MFVRGYKVLYVRSAGQGEVVMNDSAGMTRRGFVRTAGVVTAGLGLGSVMGATRADAATA